jgi:hypothetical protein
LVTFSKVSAVSPFRGGGDGFKTKAGCWIYICFSPISWIFILQGRYRYGLQPETHIFSNVRFLSRGLL